MQEEFELTEEQKELHKEVTKHKNELIMKSRIKKTRNSNPLNTKRRSLKDFEQHLEDMGIDSSEATDYVRSKSRSKSKSLSRGRSLTKEKITGEKRKRFVVFLLYSNELLFIIIFADPAVLVLLQEAASRLPR